ncbi:cryptochrome/photolyase family protein [Bacillus sp. FJAT-42376]|uniref:cryptochrome/photolyase family protein n=1 Tax=Bacillus sp. FJAT-42376 TaxID=2014076 RepID=UPI000F5069A4|nr:cryptochrome/photolyase family protein [Bacillus sp. FJAT-42376]AZB43109.1 cryptochrome/photolyase family protein [Bacillus sp. FJAT-42376]
MKTVWVFGHQLTMKLKGIQEMDPSKDIILMIEAKSRSRWQDYHKQKLVLLFSAMRHFAEELKEHGYKVDYRKCDSFEDGWKEHADQFKPDEAVLHLPADDKMRTALKKWKKDQKIQVEFLEENALFLTSEADWKNLLPDKEEWKLDPVYRKLRKEFGILMDGDKPEGGKWSFDQENRKPPKEGLEFKKTKAVRPDAITKDVIKEVSEVYGDNIGSLESFHWPVTRKKAEEAFRHFLKHRLQTFGDYQDAMMEEEPFMSHSLISSALNIGLLDPLDILEKAEKAYRDGDAPLASVEGLIRQILGWREYMRGVYLRKMPGYAKVNALRHQLPIPDFFWTAETKMNCVHQAVKSVIEHGYSHHIQRLMVLGNFAALAGIKPSDVSDWFNEAYIDAYDWVVLPNVLGMALYADDGLISTKPYVSSGNYINKMSNYCSSCFYQVKNKTGDKACPFNSLYYDYLDRHEKKLSSNSRMKFNYKNLGKLSKDSRKEILERAKEVKELMKKGEL